MHVTQCGRVSEKYPWSSGRCWHLACCCFTPVLNPQTGFGLREPHVHFAPFSTLHTIDKQCVTLPSIDDCILQGAIPVTLGDGQSDQHTSYRSMQ